MITNRFPVLIKGAPGIGKTSLVEQSAKRLGIDLIVSHPVVSDPTDYKGLPYAEGGEAHFLPFGDLKRLIHAEVPTVYFLDDMGQATPAVQSALMQLILARRVNGHKISDFVTFVSATNRREDRANVQGILDPVKSRFVSIVELNIHADDWIAWALDAGMPNDLIAFVSWKPDVLSSPGTREIENTSNPRTLEWVGRLLNAGVPNRVRDEAIAGAAGAGFSAEFNAFCRLKDGLPSYEDVVKDPKKTKLPDEMHIRYAMISVLASQVERQDIGAVLTYVDRMEPEFVVGFAKMAVKQNRFDLMWDEVKATKFTDKYWDLLKPQG